MLKHLSYANVMATVAVFVALGGSSYAAITISKNAVGPTQIRAGAVRSSEVKDGTLGTKELTAAARAALKGNAGPQGPAGAPGAAGAAGAKGDKGDTGAPGPSEAVEIHHDSGFVAIPSAAYTTIATIPGLAAGSYLFNGQINVFGTTEGLVNCRIVAGGTTGVHSEVFIGDAASAVIDSRAVTQLATTLAAPGSAQLQCISENGGVGSNGLSFSALKVGSATRTEV